MNPRRQVSIAPGLGRVAVPLGVSRRAFLLAAASWTALAWAGAVCAQAPARIRRIGLLSPWTPSAAAPWHQALRLGLRDLGWIEGRNISIEYRYAEGRSDRLADLVADLVRLKVEVIVASVTSDALVAQKATKAIPIVMVAAADPVASGLVGSLARPGGNITGLSQMSMELGGKRLELLKEMVPKLSRVAVLWNPQGAVSPMYWREVQLPARQLGIQLHSLEVRSPDDFEKAFESAIRARADAISVMPDPVIVANLKRVANLAVRSRLPSLFHIAEFVDDGGLAAYGPDRADMFRRAATFVDKILKGADPGSLPIDQAAKFELVLNLKTARAIGLSIPHALLFRADRVIE